MGRAVNYLEIYRAASGGRGAVLGLEWWWGTAEVSALVPASRQAL